MDLRALIEEKARAAKAAARSLAVLSTKVKNEALLQMARGLEEKSSLILDANRGDTEQARTGGSSRAFLDRLTLTESRIEEMAAGLRQVALLPDPVGETLRMWRRPNGMEIGKVRVPIGLIAVVYEARPNVTADTVGLCLKSGNAVILRGGSEAIGSNSVITQILAKAMEKAGVPPEGLQFIDSPDREAVRILLTLDRLVDLLIPRGGEEFIRMVVQEATVPILKHDKGLCHIYVDQGAPLDMALEIAANAKVQRPGVCNAMETLLVHQEVAPAFLPRLAARLEEAGVELRGCPKTRTLLPSIGQATETDWDTEYLDLILAIKVVEDLDEALAHIARHGSGLAEAIVTSDYTRARRFLQEVDAGCLFVNASTRLADGREFGMGAEMGISTSKLHARGPVGLEELTTTKFVVYGSGQLRE